ncbi:MAG: hypothetical protein Q8Q01_03075 [archaeon]|nr:hypothetical protein [archaeon]
MAAETSFGLIFGLMLLAIGAIIYFLARKRSLPPLPEDDDEQTSSESIFSPFSKNSERQKHIKELHHKHSHKVLEQESKELFPGISKHKRTSKDFQKLAEIARKNRLKKSAFNHEREQKSIANKRAIEKLKKMAKK